MGVAVAGEVGCPTQPFFLCVLQLLPTMALAPLCQEPLCREAILEYQPKPFLSPQWVIFSPFAEDRPAAEYRFLYLKKINQ